ncbi:carboxy terminal-processing peptidase [Nitrincola alkalilacustris]|uniref:carboxy terminal-processing peptidase n=1 Tax=Nitrincola alkalilacustris TaxID=1571224 RepID=UPI00124EC022|nr:carboxy terminal-processing peptidase [Nitrincola alkalilacustris]
MAIHNLKSVFLSLVFTCLLLTQTTALARLAPEPVHEQALLNVIAALQQNHYTGMQLDEALASNALDRYLQDLDPTRSYFYAEDIKKFESFRNTLIQELYSGDATTGFTIYNRFKERNLERLDYLLAMLNDENHTFDFEEDAVFESDRSEAEWISSEAQMNDLWSKRLKSSILSLKLADRSLEESREVLIKRYQNQRNRVEQINSEDVFERYINALAHVFDPHSQYLSPRSQENFQINMSLSLEGIGAVLQSEDEYVKIVRLVPAGPADKTGQLRAADTIVGVGQGEEGPIEDVVGQRLDDVVKLIRGPRGTKVRLEVIPADAVDRSQRRQVTIVREQVKLEEQSAQKRVLEITRDNQPYRIGVIEIPAFYIDFAAMQSGDPNYKSTTRDVEKLITELKQEGIDGLIVDLRNNGGGSLREANELTGLFISRGPTVQIRDASGRVDILGDFDPKIAWSGPLAVIVNRLSASASEIFAGAIQDYDRGLVLGSRTFGKGTVQTLLPLDHGQLKLTHAKFYRISGDSTQNKGVEPSISFPTLYDEKEIGESALEGALPWDQVHPVRYGRFPSLSMMIEELTTRHLRRTGEDPDFMFMHEQVSRMKEMRNQTDIPLNMVALRSQREEAEEWQLETENRRRLAKGEEAVETLAELELLLPKDNQGRTINPETESILNESAQVLVDYIDLTLRQTVANENKVANGN